MKASDININGQLSLWDYLREKNPLPPWLQEKEEPVPECTVSIGDRFIHTETNRTVIVSSIKYEPTYKDYCLMCDADKNSSFIGCTFYAGKAETFGWNKVA